MKNQTPHPFLLFAFCLFIVGLQSCEETPGNTGDKVTDDTEHPMQDSSTLVNATKAVAAPNTHHCIIAGTVLEDNTYWITNENVLLGISADSTTKDIDFGESHRLFTAMNTLDCSLILKETFPVNRSPDFPWYLNPNTYEAINQILCIQGIEFVFCYDVLNQNLLPRMKPQFYNNKATIDAQSGLPAGLAIWNRYLVGYALDQGGYVFDLNDREKPKAVAPSASFYSEEDGGYHNLFLLSNELGKVQALMPSLNEDQTGMDANLLFEKPRDLNGTVKKNVRDNRFIVLNSKDDFRKTAIDMEKRKAVELPSELLDKNTQVILDWLKQNKRGK